MNIFKKFYCRVFQFSMRAMLPVLPYREPKLLENVDDLIALLQKENKKSVMLVTDKGVRSLGLTKEVEDKVSKSFELTVYDKTVANPTTDNVEEALKIFKQKNCDCIIAFGGGSAMDCAKAVGARVANPKKSLAKMKGILKVRKSLPLLIAIPTTAGTGSETTLAAVITDSKTRHKYAINDFPLIPKYALLDAKVTLGLPKPITASTGMDALTHAIEAYIGRSTDSFSRKNALEACKLIFENLEEAYSNGQNLQARENMLKASYMAGLAFTRSYVGYVHAIAHSLGGKYNVAHGLANAVILPYVLKKYGNKASKKLWKIGVYVGLFDKNTPIAEGANEVIEKIQDMNKNMEIPNKIKELKAEDIPSLALTAEQEANPLYPVPKLLSAKELEEIYRELLA